MISKRLIIIAVLTVLLTRCTEDFEEINRHPNEPYNSPPEYIINGIVWGLGEALGHARSGTQLGSFAGHVTSTDSWLFQVRYGLIKGLDYWGWIYDAAFSAEHLISLGTKDNNPVIKAIGYSLKSYAFMLFLSASASSRLIVARTDSNPFWLA